jgi:hypothetical protein
MFSLDPATVGKSGYREIFQVGEALNGKPLIDRQHPHDLFMQLAAVWRMPLHEPPADDRSDAPVSAAHDEWLEPVTFAVHFVEQGDHAIARRLVVGVRSAPCPARPSAETSGDNVGHDDERVCESWSYSKLTPSLPSATGEPVGHVAFASPGDLRVT